MSAIFTIFRKELRGYLMTPYGWVILALIMALQGFSLSASLKMFQLAPQKEGILYFILHSPTFWFYFLFLFPLITMKSFAEEEKSGTLESLLTAPIRTSQVVIGKYLSAYVFYLILWVPLLFYPLITDLANVYVSTVYHYAPGMELTYRMSDWVGAYSILALIGAWFVSIGILCSSLTSSQIISGITTIGALVCIFFLGLVPVVWGEFPAANIFHYISCSEHLERFSSGLIDSRPVVFYISLTVLTLFLTMRIVDHRRWKH
ncbi:MAG: ABC transporter permease subunit [Akkermansia sp.]